jgi:hypothetical protein
VEDKDDPSPDPTHDLFGALDRLWRDFSPQIHASVGQQRCELVTRFARASVDFWASLNLEEVSSLDDIHAFRRSQESCFSRFILPYFSEVQLDERERKAIDQTIVDCDRQWVALAIERALQRMPRVKEIGEVERKLLDILESDSRKEAGRELRDAEAAAEEKFQRRKETENWQAKTLRAVPRSEYISPGLPPPPEDWAAFEYAQHRLRTITKIAQRVKVKSREPEWFVAFTKRAVQSLCKLCIAKLAPWEDISIDDQDPFASKTAMPSGFF